MLRLRRQVLDGVHAVATALAAGCGSNHRTTVLSSAFAQPSEAARYPDGSPTQAAVKLLLAVEYNDPTAAASFFGPAWKLTSRKLALQIRGPLSGAGAILGRDPRVIAEVLHGRRATLVVATRLIKRVVLEFTKVGSRWKLARARLGPLTLAPPRASRRGQVPPAAP